MTSAGGSGGTRTVMEKAFAQRRFPIRRATSGDIRQIAKLANMAGGDTLSVILQGIDPTVKAVRTYREMVAAPTGVYSYRNCLVAVSRGVIVGLANAFHARLIESETGTAMTHCLETGGKHIEPQHFRLMMACAEICRTAAHFMLLNTPHHKHVCGECAGICTECAKDCERIGGMDDCVKACKQCAGSCRAMAG
jgi:hypothetical protein